MELLDVVIQAITEKKGYDVCCYNVAEITPFMDYMIIVSTMNYRQNNAIAQNIKDRVHEFGYRGEYSVEGDGNSRWILIDLKDIVVQLFVQEERKVYDLDRLYADVPVKIYDL